MQNFYNNKTFILEFEKRTGLSMSYVTLLKYVKLGFIKQSGQVSNGKQIRPVYSEQALESFIKKLPALTEKYGLRLKNAH